MSNIARKPEEGHRGFTQEDWDEVSDTPELTDEEIAELRPVREMPTDIRALLPKRGHPRSENPKV